MSRTLTYGVRGDGAGGSVEYTRAAKPGRASAFGKSLVPGVFEKGFTNRAIECTSRDFYRRVFGGLLVESQAPLAVEDCFDEGKGAATVVVVRMTDGSERAAFLDLFSRDVDPTYGATRAVTKVPRRVATLSASSGGRWAGKAAVFGGKVANVAAAISGSTFDTGLGAAFPYAKDELKGGTFRLFGETRSWVIASNTALGEFDVVGDFVGVTATDGRYDFALANVDDLNRPKGLAAVVKDGMTDPATGFDLDVYEGRSTLRAPFANLDLDPEGAYFKAIVNESLEVSQYEVVAEDRFDGDVSLAESRPANFAELVIPGGLTARTAKFRILTFQRTGTGDGFVGTLVDGGEMVPHKYTLTVKAGALTFTVAATDLSGTTALATGLVDGTIGTAYAAPHPFLAGFKMEQGTTPFAEGDVLEVYVRPLPANLARLGGYFYPFAFAATGTGSKDVTKRFRIQSNTFDTITVGPNDDLTTSVVLPGAPTGIGTENWDTTKDTTGKTFKFKQQGGGEVTLTMTGGATQTCAQAAAELTALAGALLKVRFDAVAVAGGHTRLSWTAIDGLYGPGASFELTSGTLFTVAGFTAAVHVGATPTIGRLEFVQEFGNGRDGNDMTDAHWFNVWDAQTSPALLVDDPGCLKASMPGITDPVRIQAMLDFTIVAGCSARFDVPSTLADAAAARKWVRDNLTPKGFEVWAFPSFAYRTVNPFGGRTRYLSTVAGHILGMEARYARDNKGYQKPATDTQALLSPRFSSLPTDLPSGVAVPLDDNILNGFGAQEVRHRGRALWLWGDRLMGENFVRDWKHKVECDLHLVHEFLANLDPMTFQIINGREGALTRIALKTLLRSLLKPHFDAGWFQGLTFDEAVTIKVDPENNTPDVQAAGVIIADVSYSLVDTNEKTVIRIGQKGIVY